MKEIIMHYNKENGSIYSIAIIMQYNKETVLILVEIYVAQKNWIDRTRTAAGSRISRRGTVRRKKKNEPNLTNLTLFDLTETSIFFTANCPTANCPMAKSPCTINNV